MDELVKLVSKKTGIPEAQAKIAVKTVIGFLKKKLPAPLAAQVEGVLGNDQNVSQALDQAGNLVQGLGGLLGKKK